MRCPPVLPLALLLLAPLGCAPDEGDFGDDDDDDDSWGDDDTATSDDDGSGDDDSAPAFSIDASALGDAWLFEPYSGLLLAVGDAVEPVAFALSAGGLPAGIGLSADGLVSGAAEQPGAFSFTVQATDARARVATADLVLNVTYDPAEVYLGAVAADGVYNNMCGATPQLRQLCHPWVRVDGTGVEGQADRALLPALFHVGADGDVDDLTEGLGDDTLLQTLDPMSVEWSFEALVGETQNGPDISPTDTTISVDGVLSSGEEAGPGKVRLVSGEWGEGEVPAHVVAPDWCEPSC